MIKKNVVLSLIFLNLFLYQPNAFGMRAFFKNFRKKLQHASYEKMQRAFFDAVRQGNVKKVERIMQHISKKDIEVFLETACRAKRKRAAMLLFEKVCEDENAGQFLDDLTLDTLMFLARCFCQKGRRYEKKCQPPVSVVPVISLSRLLFPEESEHEKLFRRKKKSNMKKIEIIFRKIREKCLSEDAPFVTPPATQDMLRQAPVFANASTDRQDDLSAIASATADREEGELVQVSHREKVANVCKELVSIICDYGTSEMFNVFFLKIFQNQQYNLEILKIILGNERWRKKFSRGSSVRAFSPRNALRRVLCTSLKKHDFERLKSCFEILGLCSRLEKRVLRAVFRDSYFSLVGDGYLPSTKDRPVSQSLLTAVNEILGSDELSIGFWEVVGKAQENEAIKNVIVEEFLFDDHLRENRLYQLLEIVERDMVVRNAFMRVFKVRDESILAKERFFDFILHVKRVERNTPFNRFNRFNWYRKLYGMYEDRVKAVNQHVGEDEQERVNFLSGNDGTVAITNGAKTIRCFKSFLN